LRCSPLPISADQFVFVLRVVEGVDVDPEELAAALLFLPGDLDLALVSDFDSPEVASADELPFDA